MTSFLGQLVLDVASAGFTALLGGFAVGVIVRRTQSRNESREFVKSLGFEMMERAYSFYFITEEAMRRRQYLGEATDLADLTLNARYEEFRIAGRVIEQKLAICLPEQDARWLWHGVVDLLSVRYYNLERKDKRRDDLVERLAIHATDAEVHIPASVKSWFLDLDGLKDENRIREQFEILLEQATRLTLDKAPASRLILPRLKPPERV